jgi:hypothetical protein
MHWLSFILGAVTLLAFEVFRISNFIDSIRDAITPFA